MEITLPPKIAAWVEERVQSGEYASSSEVIGDAIRRLMRDEDDLDWDTDKLREMVAQARQAVNEGRVVSADHALETLLKRRSPNS